jgi:NADH-quinone oxidoreductase subunit A
MIQDYVPVLLHVLVAVGFATVTLALNLILGRRGRRNKTKDAPYECGVIPQVGPQPRFSVKFYLVAMLFILFDIEVVFLYPWAVRFDALGLFGFVEMLLFIGAVFVAYAYVWRRGGLDWD